MFFEIFRFEIRYQLKNPVFVIAAVIFFLLTFGAVTTDAVRIGGSIGAVNRNAPFVIMQILQIMSMIGIFTTTAFVANAVNRDFEFGTHEIFFSTPVKKRDYLLGRFAGALVAAFGVFGGVVFGVLLGSFMPWLEPERIGPTTAAPYVLSLVVLVLPNLFLTGGIFFAIASLTRSMLWTFAGVIGFFSVYLIAATQVEKLENQRLVSILDPFGGAAFDYATKWWTVAEKNTATLPLDGTLVLNRLLWMGVTVAILGFTYARFRFIALGSGAGKRHRRRVTADSPEINGATVAGLPGGLAPEGHKAGVPAPSERAAGPTSSTAAAGAPSGAGAAPASPSLAIEAGRIAAVGASGSGEMTAPSVTRESWPAATTVSARGGVSTSSLALRLRQFLFQARSETLGILRGAPFLVILGFGVLNVIGSATVHDEMFGTPVHPVTNVLLSVIDGAFLLSVILILTWYSGELVWRERALRMDGVFDALPAPTWVFWGSKLAALVACLGVVLAVGALTGMGFQAWHGYFRFEPLLYFKWLFVETGVPFVLVAVLALFVQALTNNKWAGMLMMVLFYVGLPALSVMHFEHNLYRYAVPPRAPYSDMNGFGPFVKPTFWFDLYWTFCAAILCVLVHLLWVRGAETTMRLRIVLARQRFTGVARAALAVAGAAFLATGCFIFYNTNILNRYVRSDRELDRLASYETKYKKYEGLRGLRVTAVRADVDIVPETRSVSIRGTYRLVNKTDAPVEEVHVSMNPDVKVRAIEITGSRVTLDDREIGYSIRKLAAPLPPGGETELRFDLAIVNEGFRNSGENVQVVENGTFFNSFEYFPHLGYASAMELDDPNERRRRHLPPIVRMPKLEDESARRNNYVSSESDWLDFETTVSTSPDQIALAPGYLQKEWIEGGRRYFTYKMDAPILGFWAYLSARYAVKRDTWNGVAIEVYYHPEHAWNVDRMIDATKKSLAYFSANFGPYQHRQVRIVEFPRYARFAQSFPNTIPFSESIGFIAQLENPDDIDYVFYVTAHEVAHQWWAHQVIGANVQGATVMSETLAQYSALMVMEKEYGPQKMRRFLKYELERYLRGRGAERIEELPLLRVENQPYVHYRKGSLVMYALRDAIGEDALNRALARYVKAVKFQEPPYTTSRELVDFIRAEVPDDKRGLIEDLFETITLYENKTKDATYEKRPDGTYLVRLDLDSAKFRATGSGAEKEAPVDAWIDVGVFGKRGKDDPPEGKVLALEKRHITSAHTAVELVVREEPLKAGIDPFNKLIDRSPDNNIAAVHAAGTH